MREHCRQLYRAITGIGLRPLYRDEGFPEGEFGALLALMPASHHNGLSSMPDPLHKHPEARTG